jgi:hypothetical protein
VLGFLYRYEVKSLCAKLAARVFSDDREFEVAGIVAFGLRTLNYFRERRNLSEGQQTVNVSHDEIEGMNQPTSGANSDADENGNIETKPAVQQRSVANPQNLKPSSSNLAPVTRYPALDDLAQMPIEDLTLPVALMLDAGELIHLSEAQINDHLEEIIGLVQKHKAFDVYLDRTDRYPVGNIQIANLQKLLHEFPGRVHVGMFDRTNLKSKNILIHASFFGDKTTAEDTLKTMSELKENLQLKQDILPLDYRQAGAVRAFLGIAEMLQSAELIKTLGEAIAAYAIRGRNGLWQITEQYLSAVLADLKNSYVVAWSA